MADLKILIEDASRHGFERLGSVEALKSLTLRRSDVLDLLDVVRSGADPAVRATAGQVLGYHRMAVTFPEIAGELLASARSERDPGALRGIAFALRGSEKVAALLVCSDAGAAIEAVCGVPVKDEAWVSMLDALFSGVGPQVEAAILARLPEMASCERFVVDYLMAAEFPDSLGDPAERVERLFGALNDASLFGALLRANASVDRTFAAIWPGMARRERRRVLMEIFLEEVSRNGGSDGFAREVVTRIAKDGALWEDQIRVARQVLRSLTPRSATCLLSEAEGAFPSAGKDGRRRLAEALVQVGQDVPQVLDDVERLLSKWEAAVPGARLRARQVRLSAQMP